MNMPKFEPAEFVARCRKNVLKRPHLYVGALDNVSVESLLLELVSNVINQYRAGNTSFIDVRIEGSSITVSDDGNGLPFDKESPNNTETLGEYLLSKPQYKKVIEDWEIVGPSAKSIYLSPNQLKLVITNIFSNKFEVVSWRNGMQFQISFSKGVCTNQLKLISEGIGRGTSITFEADPEIFGDTKPRLSIIRGILFEASHLFPGLTIRFNDEQYLSKRGLIDLATLNYFSHRSHCDRSEPFSYVLEHEYFEASIVAIGNLNNNQYNDQKNFETNIISWANGIKTIKHGTHVIGVTEALKNINWQPEILMVHLISQNVHFCRNPIDKVTNREYVSTIKQSIQKPLEEFVRLHQFQ